MIEVRKARVEDTVALGSVLGRAFDDDPVANFVFPQSDRRVRGLPKFFSIQLRHEYLRDQEVYTTTGLHGAALWSPPGKSRPGILALLKMLPLLPLIGRRLVPVLRMLAAIEAQHPKEPHFYLGVLGTDPPEQGRGIGSALLTPVLERCDAEGIPALSRVLERAQPPLLCPSRLRGDQGARPAGGWAQCLAHVARTAATNRLGEHSPQDGYEVEEAVSDHSGG